MRNPAPPNWEADELTAFFEDANQNTFASFVNLSDCKKIIEIDSVFSSAFSLIDNTPHWFEGALFGRAYSAYRAASRLLLAGQVTESYSLIRSCIEFSLYCFHLFTQPELKEVWLKRSDSDENKKKVKKEFQVGNIIKSLQDASPKEAEVAKIIYDRCIDFGAHPNEFSLTSTVKVIKEGDKRIMNTIQLHGIDPPMELAVKTIILVGVCSLSIFELIYKDRFVSGNINDKLMLLKQGL